MGDLTLNEKALENDWRQVKIKKPFQFTMVFHLNFFHICKMGIEWKISKKNSEDISRKTLESIKKTVDIKETFGLTEAFINHKNAHLNALISVLFLQ